jgi:hypothetical protein
MTDLLSELRRSPVQGDREVAELLHSLRPAGGSRPRASEVLAGFIAERGSGLTSCAELREPAEGSGLLVVLGSAPEPRPARRRVLTGVWAQAAVAATVALVAVAVAAGGPSRDVVVRPGDRSTTDAPATTPPADQTDPTPRRHHPVRPSAGPRTHRATPHVANTMSDHSASGQTASVRTSTPAAGGEEDGSETKGTALPEESGDDRGIDGASGTEAGGGATFDDGTATTDSGEMFDGGGGDGGETPDGVDD